MGLDYTGFVGLRQVSKGAMPEVRRGALDRGPTMERGISRDVRRLRRCRRGKVAFFFGGWGYE